MKRTIRINTGIKAGGMSIQHSRALVVRSAVKAGGLSVQHSRALGVSRP